MNLIEGLQEEMNSSRELLMEYEAIGQPGIFGAAFIKNDIAIAEKAIAQGDTVEMLRIYEILKKHA